jgi:PilZ domain-containing protein
VVRVLSSMDKYGDIAKRQATLQGTPAPARAIAAEAAANPAATEGDKIANIQRALLNFHLLLRSQRLYESDHPQRIAALGLAYDSLQSVLERQKLELHVVRDGLASPALDNTLVPDATGEMLALSSALRQAGIKRISFLPKVRLQEVDILAELVKVSLMTMGQVATGQSSAKTSDNEAAGTRDVWWIKSFAEREVEGILVNTQVDRKVDTLLTSLIATLVAYGGHSPRVDSENVRLPGFDDLIATLKLLAHITVPLEPASELSPEAGARAIHEAMEEASHDTVRLLLSAISQYSPEEGELPQFYVKRLAESLIFEYLLAEFAAGSLTPVSVRPTFDRLGEVLVAAGKFLNAPGPGKQAPSPSMMASSLAATWAAESYREKLVTRFWLELPPREKSMVLRGPDLWSVPVLALRQTLGNLADAGADAPRREARHIVLNYARRLEHEDPHARQAVAAGLNVLLPIVESLWPNQLPEDLSKVALTALAIEREPQTAAALATFIESLSHIAVVRGDYEGFEAMLLALEQPSREFDHANPSALAKRIFTQERVFLLVDAGLAHRALDPVLPRLLERDPDKLLDRLTFLLSEDRASFLPAMARLIRTIGVPVLTILETRLYEARPLRVTAAIKLLAAADPDRLLRGLTRALASWEWNMQDLAVSELSRPANAPTAQTAAAVFSSVLINAHPLVVPMMIDQIGLSGERSAIPQLMEIAAGEHTTLRDQFVRIKAIEALGRLRATESMQLLQLLAERRSGIAFAEPSGLRAAAHDALALIEDRATSASARATFEAPNAHGLVYAVPRRYTRVPLDAPLRAQVSAKAAGASLARVKSISLGGAYLESSKSLSVGESVQLEVRSGLGKKIHCTAIVRNSTPGGNGVEFVHMNDEDRTKLRKLVLRKMPT